MKITGIDNTNTEDFQLMRRRINHKPKITINNAHAG
jgi:hypothetical protein